ncbi:MAG: hypothetical protein AB8B54_05645 [Sphingorhabdus sp.]
MRMRSPIIIDGPAFHRCVAFTLDPVPQNFWRVRDGKIQEAYVYTSGANLLI